jgi:hypothetical protein
MQQVVPTLARGPGHEGPPHRPCLVLLPQQQERQQVVPAGGARGAPLEELVKVAAELIHPDRRWGGWFPGPHRSPPGGTADAGWCPLQDTPNLTNQR